MDMMEQFFEAYRVYDIDKMLLLHTDDAVWTWIDPGKNFPRFGPEGRWVGTGKDEIRVMFEYDRGEAGFSGYMVWSDVQGNRVTATELWESDWTHTIDVPLITESTYMLRDGKIAEWVWTVSPESSRRLMNTVSVAEVNKEIVRRLNSEIWNGGNLDLVDELYAEDYVRHQVGYPEELQGREGLKQFLTLLRQAFPTFECTTANLVATGDIVVHYGQVCRGIHQGEWMGMPPSGKELEFSVMDTHRLVDGKVVEDWIEYDSAAFMNVLGLELVPAQI